MEQKIDFHNINEETIDDILNEIDENERKQSLLANGIDQKLTETNYAALNYQQAIEIGNVIVRDDRSNMQYYNYNPRPKHTKFIHSLPKTLQIDRRNWRKHQSFDTQTLLIKGHRNFRKSSQRCVKLIHNVLKSNKNNKKTMESIKNARYTFMSLLSALHSHASYEEHKLFKFLEIKYNVDLSLLLEDHHKIEEMEQTCQQALDNVIYAGATTKDLVLKCLQCFIEFDENFTRHLGEEEQIVIPMLLELTYKQYVAYYNARTYKQALAI